MSVLLDDSPQARKPSTTPLVLTRNVISTLTQGLDASDMLECYALVRSAPLHGLADSTLKVQKMALGFRFRPSVSITTKNKLPLELTVEYGPQRLGPELNHEAMPFVQVEENSAFITWENVGKVYYTTKIATDEYQSSYYMASITGAVLNQILFEALGYTGMRRRYQPFAVYSVENGKEIRASSSSDFTHFIWQHLANLGVEVEPVLAPPIYEARLWVQGFSKVIPEPAAAHAAAVFYQKLYGCLEAISTGDYSAYMPTAAPTMSLEPTAATTESLWPTNEAEFGILAAESPSGEETGDAPGSKNKTAKNIPNPSEGGEASDPDSEGGADGIPDKKATKSKIPTEIEDKATNTAAPEEGDENDASDGQVLDDDDAVFSNDPEGDSDGNNRSLRQISNLEEGEIDGNKTDKPSSAPSALNSTANPTVEEHDESGAHDVEKAKQAAQEAQAAATEAKEAATTEGETKAADAAQVAANAAQTAADVTTSAASKTAMGGIRSGDGAIMSSIINTCFTNPQYDILQVDENGTLLVNAYLYGDGSVYYKLNLTSPYLEIAKVEYQPPQPISSGDYITGGDMVDWSLAFVVLGMVLLGFLVILQQIGFYYYEPLFRRQKWLFNPSQTEDDHRQEAVEREGAAFTFGSDAIPLSMGGVRSPNYSRRLFTTRSTVEETSDLSVPDITNNRTATRPKRSPVRIQDRGESFGDVELKHMSSSQESSRPARVDSLSESFDDEPTLDTTPSRLYRDPDLVAMPHLKSSSKVAVPVGFANGRDRANGYASDESSYSEVF